MPQDRPPRPLRKLGTCGRSLIVDVQNDFCEGGSLEVVGGQSVARAISEYLATPRDYAHIVATKDFHIDPGEHFSDHPDFAASWPPHCVVGTAGADFHPEFDPSAVEAVFTKGRYSAAYSGFEGTDEAGTPLADWLGNAASTKSTSSGSPRTTASSRPPPTPRKRVSPPACCLT